MIRTPTFSLNNFDGPLELLLYLIQKEEIDVCDISLKTLTDQFFNFLSKTAEIDQGAETLQLAACLLLIKSRKLLPSPTQETDLLEDELRIELIEHVMEYCRFRQTAELLAQREEEQKAFFPRKAPLFRKELGSGLEEISLNDLKKFLAEALAKTEKRTEAIQPDMWLVETFIQKLKKEFSFRNKISFFEIFSKNKCREELIVSFLALLELMKAAVVKIEKENEALYIISYE